jgi:hypothetical protein
MDILALAPPEPSSKRIFSMDPAAVAAPRGKRARTYFHGWENAEIQAKNVIVPTKEELKKTLYLADIRTMLRKRHFSSETLFIHKLFQKRLLDRFHVYLGLAKSEHLVEVLHEVMECYPTVMIPLYERVCRRANRTPSSPP